MSYIFLDESGDLGFKKSSSKWFVFVAAIVSDARSLERVAKKAWQSLKRKHKTAGELHAYHEKDITRLSILKSLGTMDDLKIACFLFEKKTMTSCKHKDKNLLYQNAAYNLLASLLSEPHVLADKSTHIFFDRTGMKEKSRKNFIERISNLFKDMSFRQTEIRFESSHANKSIQMADFILS